MIDRPDSLQIVGKISGGVRRLEALVSQVLQFTREMTARIVSVDLAEALAETVEMACPQLQAKKVTCAVRGPSPMWVKVDPLLIQQAVLNLILNAADAIEGGGAIAIEYDAALEPGDGKQFNLVVRDSGPGIPAIILDRIFNPFFTTKETGTGLGLAIVHRVVEAHDGNIVVTNVDSGGAKFEIRI